MYKLLLVDDDYIAREGLRDLHDWAQAGIDIVGEAEDGKEALRKARRLQPDIVLTDVVMPVMNGIELVEQLRKERPDIQAIMISAHQDIRFIKASMKLEAVDYILKPFNLDELRQVVGKVLERLDKERSNRRLEEDVSRHFAESLSSSGLPALFELQERILETIGSGSDQPQLLERCIKDYFRTVRENGMDSLLFLGSRCGEIVIKALVRLQIKDGATGEPFRASLQHLRLMNSSYQLEDYLLKTLQEMKAAVLEERGGSSRKAVRDVQGIIRRGYYSNLTIQQLAAEVFVSPGHLQALFKKETSQTINDYITSIRIDKAKELLRQPGVKIYEVAKMVGYQDTHYFSRIFKKWTGVNPLDYREEQS
ncbi:response regulator [Paenibacillus sp. HWE-109]|uniref:response regulator transcription factor n=1 Tax=Paenibacillus sp. HWE-109 TaxID=1306526 RepID=UPI001EDF39BA|nr:response regulator [Paenibacillus sp. HWE-109]UKS29600.1 response regulator [Paenibacillus sp. HWE-109]